MKLLTQKNSAFCLILLIFGMASLVTAVSLYHSLQQDKKKTESLILDDLEAGSLSLAQNINQKLKSVVPLVNEISASISQANLKSDAIRRLLEKRFHNTPELLDLASIFVPFAHDPEIRLHAPRVRRQNQDIVHDEIAYDYTLAEHSWYQVVLARGRAYWSEPFFHSDYKQMVICYGAPFYKINGGDKKLRGIIIATVPIQQLQEMLAEMSIRQSGYGFLLASNGRFIVHPNDDYIQNRNTFFDTIGQSDEVVLPKIQKALSGSQQLIDVPDASNGKMSWVSMTPLKAVGWTLGVSLFKDELAFYNPQQRHQLIWVSMCVLFGLMLLLSVYTLKRKERLGVLSLFISVVSILLIVEISVICYLRINLPDPVTNQGALMVSKTLLKKHLEKRRFELKGKRHKQAQDAVLLPTGILLQSISLLKQNNIKITGYLWQKIPLSHPDIMPGFHFSNAVEAIQREVVLDSVGKKYREVGWFFSTTIRVAHNAETYPLDVRNIHLHIYHQQLDVNIISVPDLEAYTLLAPSALSGISTSLALPGWEITRSYFSYGKHNSEMDGPNSTKDVLNLRFNIIAQRQFRDPFVSIFLPLIGISFILYSLLIITTKDPEKLTRFGYNKINSYLGPVSGLLFALILIQIRMRDNIGASTIVYVEYFYFVMYLAIISVLFNDLLYNSKIKTPWLEYQNNLLPKLVFWPLLLFVILIITIVFIY